VSKYSFSLRAWLLGADQRSTGFVVALIYTKPEQHIAMKTTEKRITGRGFLTQKAPHDVNVILRPFSNLSPSLSPQVIFPVTARRKQEMIEKSVKQHFWEAR